MEKLFDNYWTFLRKRNEFQMRRPVLRWYASEDLNELQRVYFDFVKDCPTLLDYGAGDLSLKRKFERAGFRGQYVTCDVARDFEYDFGSLDEIVEKGVTFDAILILEVIEHIPLHEFERFFPRLLSRLNPGGRLILSTPNARSLIGLWGVDMTHVHPYPLADLWALLSLRGFECVPYRVILAPKPRRLRDWIRLQLAKVITNILGVDYATGVALLCRKVA